MTTEEIRIVARRCETYPPGNAVSWGTGDKLSGRVDPGDIADMVDAGEIDRDYLLEYG